MAKPLVFTGVAPERVNKFLGQSGICSRREAEALILAGQVLIDGVVVREPGHKIMPGQTLELTTTAQNQLASQFAIIINKPVGYVSSQPEPGQVPATRLLTRQNLDPRSPRDSAIPARDQRLAPAGRLDQDSRGLLILTEDGVLVKAVIGPDSRLDKEYLVRVTGTITDDKVRRLCHGLALDGRQLKPARVVRIDVDALNFTLMEGRNRQIRRMCALVGLDVVDLVRVRIGPLDIGDLPEGCWRPLTPAEIQAVVRAA